MPRKVFVAGEILTAADVNTNLMDQAVMSFAGTAARGSAIPSPVEGMVTYLNDSDSLQVYNGSAWGPISSILQVVSTTKTDTFSTTSASFVDVTGLSATITPSSTSSKILISVSLIVASATTQSSTVWRITGGNATNYVGDAAGNRTRGLSTTTMNVAGAGPFEIDDNSFAMAGNYLDSPATTSAVTYKVQLANPGSVQDGAFVNRTGDDSDSAIYARGASTITVMEVAG